MQFNTQDKLNFLVLLMEKYNHTFKDALFKVGLSEKEMIYAHDNLLPLERQIEVLSKGNRKYHYMGNGYFRRVNKNGKPCIDGKSKMVDGAKKLGFMANPLEIALNGKEESV